MSKLKHRKQTKEMKNKDLPFQRIGSKPHAIQIVVANEDHTFSLNEEALSEVLMHDDIKDRYVIVVSIAGAYRQGKSFMLNFFLKYMDSKYTFFNHGGDWLGFENVPRDGFSWRGGSNRNTTGILMWSKIFLTEITGDKVAIIFLDTQGTFDHESTIKDCTQIFALSTMVSSVQIYNLSQDIFAYDLHHLQYFTEYGRLALDETDDVPFQKLQFLVRDWKYPRDYKYGADGGKKLLDDRLKIVNHQHRDLQNLKKHIKSCFSEIGCFLMPHPGLIVANSEDFNGKLSDIESEFKDNLRVLVPMLLAPENLVMKKICGHKVKAGDLVQYFKSYIEIYHGTDLPGPKTLFIATAEANNLSAAAEAKSMYDKLMDEACGEKKPHLRTKRLEAVHEEAKKAALNTFRNKKMGGRTFSKKYEEKLKKDLGETFEQFKSANENKNTTGKTILSCLNLGTVTFTGLAVSCLIGGTFGTAFGLAALTGATSYALYRRKQ